MSGRLHITADPARVSMAGAIRAAAEAAPLLVLTSRALADLAEELGGMDAAALHLLELAEANGKPLGVNLPTGADTSSTAFIAPGTWSRERVQGWIGARHAELEAEFGPVSKVGSELPAPGGGA